MKNQQTELGQNVVQAALKYEKKLFWTTTETNFTTYSVANDFIINFCESIGEVPQNIKNYVAKKLVDAQTRSFELSFQSSHLEMTMCCWEFCFLVLFDAGVITKKEIDQICSIAYVKNKLISTNSNNADALEALYREPFAYPYNEEAPPNPGDLLLFRSKVNASRIIHAAIFINEEQYIDLIYFDVAKNPINKGFDGYVVPLSQIRENIKNYIEINQDKLQLIPTYKMSEDEIINQLKITQYESFLSSDTSDTSDLNTSSFIVQKMKALEMRVDKLSSSFIPESLPAPNTNTLTNSQLKSSTPQPITVSNSPTFFKKPVVRENHDDYLADFTMVPQNKFDEFTIIKNVRQTVTQYCLNKQRDNDIGYHRGKALDITLKSLDILFCMVILDAFINKNTDSIMNYKGTILAKSLSNITGGFHDEIHLMANIHANKHSYDLLAYQNYVLEQLHNNPQNIVDGKKNLQDMASSFRSGEICCLQ